MVVAKGIGAAARLNAGIGGDGSRLKAGTTRVLYLQIQFSPLSSSGLTGRSSTPRPIDVIIGVSGILVPLVKPGDDE
jgi:hypothetical protein